jgi:hypothetical protein
MEDQKDNKITPVAPIAPATPGYAVKNAVDPNAEHIMVKSALPPAPDGGNRVALFERDPAHPDGEAFVAGPDPVKVGKSTVGVLAALREGRIVVA